MINVFDVKTGQTIELTDGRKADVVENMEDGMWLNIHLHEEEDVAITELCHAQDIKRILPA